MNHLYSCVALPANCLVADSKGKCTTCASGYKVNSKGECDVVVETGSGDNCAVYGYIDAKGKWWTKWVAGCKKVCK